MSECKKWETKVIGEPKILHKNKFEHYYISRSRSPSKNKNKSNGIIKHETDTNKYNDNIVASPVSPISITSPDPIKSPEAVNIVHDFRNSKALSPKSRILKFKKLNLWWLNNDATNSENITKIVNIQDGDSISVINEANTAIKMDSIMNVHDKTHKSVKMKSGKDAITVGDNDCDNTSIPSPGLIKNYYKQKNDPNSLENEIQSKDGYEKRQEIQDNIKENIDIKQHEMKMELNKSLKVSNNNNNNNSNNIGIHINDSNPIKVINNAEPNIKMDDNVSKYKPILNQHINDICHISSTFNPINPTNKLSNIITNDASIQVNNILQRPLELPMITDNNPDNTATSNIQNPDIIQKNINSSLPHSDKNIQTNINTNTNTNNNQTKQVNTVTISTQTKHIKMTDNSTQINIKAGPPSPSNHLNSTSNIIHPTKPISNKIISEPILPSKKPSFKLLSNPDLNRFNKEIDSNIPLKRFKSENPSNNAILTRFDNNFDEQTKKLSHLLQKSKHLRITKEQNLHWLFD